MLLQRLVERGAAMDDVPPMYAWTRIKYLVDLDADGSRATIVTQVGREGKGNDSGKEMLAPTLVRAGGIKARLLADNGEYALGWSREGGDPAKVAARHAAFVECVRACAEATGNADVAAVLRFLDGAGLAGLDRPEDFDPSANLTFRVDGRLPIDEPDVRAYWAQLMAPEADEGAVEGRDQCLVCGRLGPTVERLQFKIKGIPGGQSSGTALISANAPAFESYGLEASRVSPICADCAERFSKALNALLADERTRLRVGGLVYAFWTREERGFSAATLLSNPDPIQVKELIDAARRGREAALDIDPTAFYAVGLAASGGRVAVRDWIDTTIGDVKLHLGEWFGRQRIIGASGEEPKPLGLFALAAATVRDAAKDLPATTPRALLRSALTGAPAPWDVLYQAVRRCRVEQRVTRNHAALIKLVLLSHEPEMKEDAMMQLDPEHPSPAYHCGRLLAVLEEVQRLAIPGAKATIVDRFYGTASSAPASVFGRLLRGAQPHLATLKRDRPGAYVVLQQRLEEVQSRLAGFPTTLTLKEQGLFALGYYHQRAFDRAQAREAAERRKAGQVLPAAETAELASFDLGVENGQEER